MKWLPVSACVWQHAITCRYAWLSVKGLFHGSDDAITMAMAIANLVQQITHSTTLAR